MNTDPFNTDLYDLPIAVGRVPHCFITALSQEGVPHVAQESGGTDPAARFYLYDARLEQRPQLLAGQTAINVRGLHVMEGVDALELLADTGAIRAEWLVQDWNVQETVAAIDRRAVRKGLMRALQSQIEQAGGIWARLCAYPFPYQSAFNFRLDCDEDAPPDFHAVLDAEAGFEDCFSHYVCGEAYQRQPSAMARLRDLHVGGHGFYHHTYRDAVDNLRNIERGMDVLTSAGLRPDGFVAPHGRYNAGLETAMNQLGLSHSSEFALGYQDWPYFPLGSQVLQVPVHPLCLGIFLDTAQARRAAGAPGWKCDVEQAVTALTRHFCRVVEQCHAAGEPAFLYGHPERRLGRYPRVIRSVLRTVENFPGMWRTNLSRFASWWRERQQVQCQVRRTGGALHLVASRLPSLGPAALEIFGGDRMAKIEISAGRSLVHLQDLNYRTIAAMALPAARSVQLRNGLKARVRNFLDWEKATPLAEIRTETWRGWAKHRLRSWQSSAADGATQPV